MADAWNPFDDEGGAFQGADPGFQTLTGRDSTASNAPAPIYGTTRTGGGPDAANFTLGGDPNWTANYAAAGNAEYGRRAGMADAAAAAAAGRATPTTDFGRAQGALGSVQGAEGMQGDVYGGLMNFANGPQGPSAAEATAREGANRSLRQNLAMARGGSGFGESTAGLAGAQRAHTDATAAAAAEGARIRAAEDQAFRGQQLQAFGQAGGVAGQIGSSALGRAGAEAGQAQFLTQAELEAQRQRDQAQLAFGQQGLDAFGRGRNEELAAQQAALGGRMGLEGTRADIYGAELGHQIGTRQLNQQNSMNYIGGITGFLSGGGGLASMAKSGSDRRMKKNIRRTDLAERYEALQ